jgi:hypothetical protein
MVALVETQPFAVARTLSLPMAVARDLRGKTMLGRALAAAAVPGFWALAAPERQAQMGQPEQMAALVTP